MSDLRGVKYRRGQSLVYRSASADERFWDERWAASVERSFRTAAPKRTWLADVVRHHLRAPARVLEGGSGLAEHARALANDGYEMTALDFAPDTIEILRRKAPFLHPTLGDVRSLPFDQSTFDGYLSPGVIEHFYDGWNEIAAEAFRVLRSRGLFFVTFPAMSPLRRVLLHGHQYPEWDEAWRSEFYQFALEIADVELVLKSKGFQVESRRYAMALSGLEDAFPRLEGPIDWFRRSQFPVRAFAGLVGKLLEPIAGHIAIVVARRP